MYKASEELDFEKAAKLRDIIFELKRKPVMINNSFVSNFTFIDSKKNIMVQLSDVAIGITSKYLSFIDNL